MVRTKEEAIQTLLSLTSYCNEKWLFDGINALLSDLENINNNNNYKADCDYFKEKTDDKWILSKIYEIYCFFESKENLWDC